MTEKIELILQTLPDSPGVYRYYDEQGEILYVGKAKNLKKRVSSYFQKEHDSAKTRVLVRQIRDIKYLVVNSEEEALLLENSLIKQEQPRYNILLKDDKSYPRICVTNEPFPRVFMTRQIIKGIGKYYGPYTNVPMAKAVLQYVLDLYPVRRCRLNLTPEHIQQGRFKACLQYHIKNCNAPCIGLESMERYAEHVTFVRRILQGETHTLLQDLRKQMEYHSSEMRFEEAQKVKEQYLQIERYRAKNSVSMTSMIEADVYSYVEDEDMSVVNYMAVRQGAICQSYTIAYRKRIQEEPKEILALAVAELRHRFLDKAKEIILPFDIEIELSDVVVNVPQRGDKKKLLDISTKNALQYQLDMLKQREKLNPEQRVVRLLSTVQRDLQTYELPMHIECFDNSNIQGTNPVAACVVFKQGKPAKKDYRHFHIKSVVGPDDFASMNEVVYRRYSRLLDEEAELPQLIIIDGGKGQLNAAYDALKQLNLHQKIPVIGIAKRLEEIYRVGDPIPLYLDKNSETLRLIQQMRDEAHRFGITFHRKLRGKGQIKSQLDHVPGIGPKSKIELLRQYKSVKRIAEQSVEDLSKIVGQKKALLLLEYLNKKEQ